MIIIQNAILTSMPGMGCAGATKGVIPQNGPQRIADEADLSSKALPFIGFEEICKTLLTQHLCLKRRA